MEDHGLLDEFKEMERIRQKIRYKLQSPLQRKRSNELARIRMAEKRKRNKEDEESKKRLRSFDIEEFEEKKDAKRIYWRQKQAESKSRKNNALQTRLHSGEMQTCAHIFDY